MSERVKKHMKIIKADNYQNMSRKAANIISAQIILFPESILGLATGSTPLGVYRQLIEWYQKGDVDFLKIVSVNLDEYCGLSPEHPQSYHYYMQENFFNHINILPQNINIPNGLADDIEAECVRYDDLIAKLGGIDLQLLGLGHSGHIGFNEPAPSFDAMTHKIALTQQTINANARFFRSKNEVPKYAVTMGIRAIMQAEKILLMVSGKDKAEILKKTLFGPVTPNIPASILQLHPNVTVVADQEALSSCHMHLEELCA
jgi:glucosamine-6-phosphate deaminase